MAETGIKLNEAQSRAVEQIDGPMLVLAGPGTGKTQLLSARVAKILEKTDTLANNILCLTFTEAGAANMLERLTSFIGQAAYEVNISTYHAFGGSLISSHPEYFNETRMESLIDELGQHQVLMEIVNKLSYQNPLKSTMYHLGDLISTISEVKRGLLAASDLRKIAGENLEFLAAANPRVSEIFSTMTRMPTKLDKAEPYFEQCYDLLAEQALAALSSTGNEYSPLVASASASLKLALDEAAEEASTKKLTAWKNEWLIKNKANELVLTGELEAKKLAALADVLESYEKELASRGLYDYDDMILRSITALEANDDFRFTLQEQYQYILLDEYQDTSVAQARLVELLTDNPVSEGRPNVMAVGDDDQAIYAFQGAEASNLADFANNYRDTTVISLTENYRSQPDIIESAANIAAQISDRASTKFNVSKELVFSGEAKKPTIIRQEFLSGVAQRDWIAKQIEHLILKDNVKPSQIAVLAPQHRYLEPLVPFLNQLNIPVRYEKRENILEASIVRQLVAMSRLVLALKAQDEQLANSLWPEVLSYDFWQIETEEIWRISWSEGQSWTKKLLSGKLRWVALFFMQLAGASELESLETMLDYMIGSAQVRINDPKIKTATSPLKKYYTSSSFESEHPDMFYQTISHLTVLRQKLRERQAGSDELLKLTDLVDLVDLYETSGTRMINTSPYNQASESVQLMTVFKAKGLEFEHVFLVDCVDEVWGSKVRGNSNKLTLPANLSHIRRAGATEDERLRVLFVALTRAKTGLYLASATSNYTGKSTTRLKYFDEVEQPDESFKSQVLPEKYQRVETSDNEVPDITALENDWRVRHLSALSRSDLKSLLAEKIASYQLSPTHLNTFIDLERSGPREFLLNTLLRFPQAPTSGSQYGNAIHETLEWLQLEVNQSKKPTEAQIAGYFEKRMMLKRLPPDETERRIEQGKDELHKYLGSHHFKAGDKAEEKFRAAGVFLGKAHLNGKIDKIEIDKDAHELAIVDYKTGAPEGKWQSNLKLHKYKQQLYFYKLLVEGSSAWAGWRVASERLDFTKPDARGESVKLELKFDQTEFEHIKALVQAVWQKIINLDFPDVSGYSADLKGVRQFEADLISGKV